MPYKFNPLSGVLDYYEKDIDVLSSDPASPRAGQVWLLVANTATPVGLLLSITHELPATSQLSVYNGSAVVRTTLT